MVTSLKQLAHWVEWGPMITQEEGKRKSAAGSEGNRISTPVTCDPNPCCGTRFSEAVSLKTCFSLLAQRVQSCVYDMSDVKQCTLLSHLRSRWWSHNKVRTKILYSSIPFSLVSWCQCCERKQCGNMDRIHWAAVSLISLLPAPWKTLERRTCLVTLFTEFSALFQCLLENSQLIVETGTILMLGFWSGSSQSIEV